MTEGERLGRVAIIGGGMAGLTTAWELSHGVWREQFEAITVYQRGWRLGGKGASSRGRDGRIEEHGLHILLGYYQDTFRVMDACYQELDRPRNRPNSAIKTWDDALKPAATIGLTEIGPSGWRPWSMEFPARPGRPGNRETLGQLDGATLAIQSLRLLVAFYTSHHDAATPPVALAAHAKQPQSTDAVAVLRRAGLTVLAGLVELAGRSGGVGRLPGLGPALEAGLGRLRSTLYEPLLSDDIGTVTWTLVDMVMTNLVGIVGDRLLTRPEGLSAIDDMDYRAWLRRHGASAETVDNGIIRGMYDLVFAYRQGDRDRPAFAAGLGLQLATRMLLDYDGSLFWKMQAGMGEVIFAPLYEALVARGVTFEFFHRVDDLEIANASISAVRIGRQVDLVDPSHGYRPLVDWNGLPAWPASPDESQLVDAGRWVDGTESFHGERHDAEQIELVAGRDFDIVVFAASLGIVPIIAGQLVAADPRWRAMVDNVGTVATQAFQLWLNEDEKSLGWLGGDGVTLSGFAPPFDTWASMSHLLASEGITPHDSVRSLAYFCGSLADGVAAHSDANQLVRRNAIAFLEGEVGTLWPNAVDDSGKFRWEIVATAQGRGRARFDSQYWRANVDPSDRYVQSLPGSDRYRISPGDSGFANLVIAGDWTDCGLNAGCIEAATRSGILAAAAVIERLNESDGVDR